MERAKDPEIKDQEEIIHTILQVEPTWKEAAGKNYAMSWYWPRLSAEPCRGSVIESGLLSKVEALAAEPDSNPLPHEPRDTHDVDEEEDALAAWLAFLEDRHRLGRISAKDLPRRDRRATIRAKKILWKSKRQQSLQLIAQSRVFQAYFRLRSACMDVLEDQAAMLCSTDQTFGTRMSEEEPEQTTSNGPAESSSLSSDLTMGSEDEEVDQDGEGTAIHDHAESMPMPTESSIHPDELLATPSLPQAAYLAAVTEATQDSDGPFAVADFVMALKSAAEAVDAGCIARTEQAFRWADLGLGLWMTRTSSWTRLEIAKLVALLDTPGGLATIPGTAFQDLEESDRIITALVDAAWKRCPGAGGTDTLEQEGEGTQTGTNGDDATGRQNERTASEDENPLVDNASAFPLPDGQAVPESFLEVVTEQTEPEIDPEPLGRRLDFLNAASLDLLKLTWKFADKLLEVIALEEPMFVHDSPTLPPLPAALLEPPARRPWAGLPPCPVEKDFQAPASLALPARRSRPVPFEAGYSDIFLRPRWSRYQMLRSMRFRQCQYADEVKEHLLSIKYPTVAPLESVFPDIPLPKQVVMQDRCLEDTMMSPTPFLRRAVVSAAEEVMIQGGESMADKETRLKWEMHVLPPDVVAVFEAARATGMSLSARRRAFQRYLALQPPKNKDQSNSSDGSGITDNYDSNPNENDPL